MKKKTTLHRVVSGASFFTEFMFECDLAHRRSVAILCMLYKIRCNLLHPLYGAVSVSYVPVRVTRGAIDSLMHLFAAEPRSIAGLLFCFQYHCGTIFVTPYTMVWDWRVSRAGPMSLYWPSCSLPFCLLLSLLSFYVLVLRGWRFLTDRVLIALSQPWI